MKKVYVDSNVFISLILNEFGKNFEFMSYKSKYFFDKIINYEYQLVISNLVINEVCRITCLSVNDFIDFLIIFDNLIIVSIEEKQLLEAKKINSKNKIGLNDSLHFVIARDSGCFAIVTWNKKDFEFPENYLRVFDPREF